MLPRMGMIWTTFGARRPKLTEWLFDLLGDPALISVLVTALGAQAFLLAHLLLHYLGWLPWELPLLNRVLRRLDTALVLRSLALMVERKRPMSTALLAVARSHHKAWIRRRLRRAELEVSNGVDWCTALRSQGVITAHDAALLSSAERAGNLPWALRAVADSGERRLMHRLQAVVLVVYPLIIVALGLFVFMYAAGLLLPMFHLIEGLAP
jgi:general secretion pathway protein F